MTRRRASFRQQHIVVTEGATQNTDAIRRCPRQIERAHVELSNISAAQISAIDCALGRGSEFCRANAPQRRHRAILPSRLGGRTRQTRAHHQSLQRVYHRTRTRKDAAESLRVLAGARSWIEAARPLPAFRGAAVADGFRDAAAANVVSVDVPAIGAVRIAAVGEVRADMGVLKRGWRGAATRCGPDCPLRVKRSFPIRKVVSAPPSMDSRLHFSQSKRPLVMTGRFILNQRYEAPRKTSNWKRRAMVAGWSSILGESAPDLFGPAGRLNRIERDRILGTHANNL